MKDQKRAFFSYFETIYVKVIVLDTLMYAYNPYYLLLQVWDRRQLSENCPYPVGVLAGHADGITHIDPRVCYILFEVPKHRSWLASCT